LCLLLLIIAVSLATEWYHYLISMCVIGVALAVAKLPLFIMLKEMKFFAVMIVMILLMSGIHFAGRLALMVLISTVMAGTTPLSTLKNAIEWYLRPIPFVPEVRIAMMINLTFVLIPVIFDQYLEMMNAQKARGIQLNKNPIRRVKLMVMPLLTRTLGRADTLVHAMEARCYSEVRTRVIFETSKVDWLMFMVCVVVLLTVFL